MFWLWLLASQSQAPQVIRFSAKSFHEVTTTEQQASKRKGPHLISYRM